MKDQPSTSDNDDDEPVRFTIPQPPIEEYLVYSEEAGGYYCPWRTVQLGRGSLVAGISRRNEQSK